MELFDDLPYSFTLITDRVIRGTVDNRETAWASSGHPMVLALKIAGNTERVYIPWHAVVTYVKG